MCKYHGWRYGLDGKLNFVLQEEEYFDFDKDDFGLIPVQCESWEGFIFMNLDRGAAAEPARVPGADGDRPRRISVRSAVRALRVLARR